MAARRRKIPPVILLTMLADPAVIQLWTAARVSHERKRLGRLHRQLFGPQAPMGPLDPLGGHRQGLCCSHRWALDAWTELTPYPPRPESGTAIPLMPQCRRCGAAVPRHYLGSSGACMDCRLEMMPEARMRALQASASVIDFRALRGRAG